MIMIAISFIITVSNHYYLYYLTLPDLCISTYSYSRIEPSLPKLGIWLWVFLFPNPRDRSFGKLRVISGAKVFPILYT